MATSVACDPRPLNSSPITSRRRLRESRRTPRSTATRRFIHPQSSSGLRWVQAAMMDLDQLAFEVERFEWQGDDRLEVSGRWYGVRGRRFMRPTLHVRAGGRRRRMIALLDHKPWAADSEDTWVAAFAWR